MPTQARADAEPRLAWPVAQVRRFRGRLHLLPAELPEALEIDVPVQPAEPLSLAGQGRLDWLPGSGIDPQKGPYRLRTRQGGERLQLGGHRRRIKELLRTAAIPPWERRLLPLLTRGDEPVAIPGIAVADGFRADPPESGFMPLWTPRAG